MFINDDSLILGVSKTFLHICHAYDPDRSCKDSVGYGFFYYHPPPPNESDVICEQLEFLKIDVINFLDPLT